MELNELEEVLLDTLVVRDVEDVVVVGVDTLFMGKEKRKTDLILLNH